MHDPIYLPTVFKATFVTTNGRRRQRRSGRFRTDVPVVPLDVSASELRLAIHVEGDPKRAPYLSKSGEDLIHARGDKLYRPLLTDGRQLRWNEFLSSGDYRLSASSAYSFHSLPPPPGAMTARHGIRSVEMCQTLDERAAREAWVVLETLESDREEAFTEASAHYADAVLLVDGAPWVRCGEPCWMIDLTGHRLIYKDFRNTFGVEHEFPLDDPGEAAWVVAETTNIDPRRLTLDAQVTVCDWTCDRTDFLVTLGLAVLDQARVLREATTRRVRDLAGCDEEITRLVALGDRPLQFADVSRVVDAVAAVAEALYKLEGDDRPWRTACHALWYARRANARLAHFALQMPQLSSDDMEALQGFAEAPWSGDA